MRANILAHHSLSVRPGCFGRRREVKGILSPICQQHGSSRKVTLKSSCGHSMVPTARAHAGLCQEIPTALPAVDLWTCLHVWRRGEKMPESFWIFLYLKNTFCCFVFLLWLSLLLFVIVKACDGGNMPKALSWGKDWDIAWQISSLALAHAC